MTRQLAATFVGVLVLVCSSLAQTGGGRLQISWIDVEGGASTLFVAPNGQSLLFDTGFPGNDDRDAKRSGLLPSARSICVHSSPKHRVRPAISKWLNR